MAKRRNYLILSATVFAIVAIAHIVRAIQQWPITIGPWNIAVDVSWFAGVASAALSGWGWLLAFDERRG